MDVLNHLAGDSWENFAGIAGVRLTVAANPNTPSETLRDLAGDQDWNVRARVAGNRSTPADVLMAFVTFEIEFVEVREAVAENPRTPIAVLDALARGEFEDEWIDGYDEDDLERIRSVVAANASTPAGALAVLAVDPSPWVRKVLHANPKASPETRARAALLGLGEG